MQDARTSNRFPAEIRRWLLPCVLLFLLLTGCSSKSAKSLDAMSTPLPASVKPMQASSKEARILRTARSLIGTPYKWGGYTPKTGFDCSGFVWFVFHQNGIQLPRMTWQQFDAGKAVKYDKLRPGDIMFYHVDKKGKSLHAGILTDRGTFIHAPSSGKRVMESSLNNIYWRERYIGARRVL